MRITIVYRTDLPPHRLDDKIRAHVQKLRRLIRERANDHISEALRGRKFGADTIAKRVAKTRGRKCTKEARERMSKAHKGVPLSDSHLAAIKASHARRRGIKRDPVEAAIFGERA